jgi:hypothetical protein
VNGAHVPRGVMVVLLTLPWLASPAVGAEAAQRRTGWAELSRVEPGTAVVVYLTDGRRLERFMVDATAEVLNTVDLSLVSSRDRRTQVLDLVRDSPQRYVGPVFVEQDGTRIPITQRIDRAIIVIVSRPKPAAFKPPAPLLWMVHYAGPCPNCDTAQTAFSGETPLPSPLPRKAESDPLIGDVLYRAPAAVFPNPLDELMWEQLRLFLPASLRGK